MQKSNNKTVSKEVPEYDYLLSQLDIRGQYPDTPSFFILSFCCWTFENCINIEGLTFHANVSMSCFLETDIKEQKSYEKGIQTSVENTVKRLRYEIKFENLVKEKNNFFIKRNIAFLF